MLEDAEKALIVHHIHLEFCLVTVRILHMACTGFQIGFLRFPQVAFSLYCGTQFLIDTNEWSKVDVRNSKWTVNEALSERYDEKWTTFF